MKTNINGICEHVWLRKHCDSQFGNNAALVSETFGGILYEQIEYFPYYFDIGIVITFEI